MTAILVLCATTLLCAFAALAQRHPSMVVRTLAAGVLTLGGAAITFVVCIVALILVDAIPFLSEGSAAPWAWPLVCSVTVLVLCLGGVRTWRLATTARRTRTPAEPGGPTRSDTVLSTHPMT